MSTSGRRLRDEVGNYLPAWYVAGSLSLVAALLSLRIRRRPAPLPVEVYAAAAG